MNPKDLPVWVQIVAAVVAVIAGVTFVQFSNLAKMRKDITSKTERLSALRTENNQNEQVQKKQAEMEAEISRLEDQIKQLVQILPTRIETDILVSKIKSLADNFNIAIVSIKPQKSKRQEVVDEFAFDFQVEGTYHSLAMFFEKLGKMERIVDVKNLKIKPLKRKGSSATIGAAFSARTYVYRESSGEDEAKEKKGKAQKK